MRENPDTSLKLLRLLADEPHFPSRLTAEDITSQLGTTDEETVLHVKCCVDNGLVEADLLTSLFPPPTRVVVGQIWGLTGKGQEFVRQADAEGKWWEKAKERCAKAGVDASTSALRLAMDSLVRAALKGHGLA